MTPRPPAPAVFLFPFDVHGGVWSWRFWPFSLNLHIFIYFHTFHNFLRFLLISIDCCFSMYLCVFRNLWQICWFIWLDALLILLRLLFVHGFEHLDTSFAVLSLGMVLNSYRVCLKPISANCVTNRSAFTKLNFVFIWLLLSQEGSSFFASWCCFSVWAGIEQNCRTLANYIICCAFMKNLNILRIHII
jgi:hypothetical protein